MIFANGNPAALVPLGATRSITEQSAPIEAKRERFSHPLIAVGPFTFNPQGQRTEWRDGQLPYEAEQFLFRGLSQISKKACTPQSPACYGPKYRGWDFRVGDGFPISKAYLPALKGDAPIYKVENPIEGGNWGLYIERTDRNSIIVHFKRVPESWWSKVFGWIQTLVGVIIDTVRGLFSFLKGIACAQAAPILDAVAGYAAGEFQLPGAVAAKVQAAGVSTQELVELEMGANSVVAKTVGQKIVDAFCGSTTGYPPGAFAVWDPASNQYLILVPNK